MVALLFMLNMSIDSLAAINNNYQDIEILDVSNNLNSFENLNKNKKGYGQGTAVDEKNRPIDAIKLQEKYKEQQGIFIGEDSNKIYLTFDQGYETGNMTKILDVLKEKKVSVVFFVDHNYVSKNRDLILRMINEGHIIGNHTYSHPSMPDLSLEKVKEEITKFHDYMVENFNYNMTLLRPPRGEYSEQTLAVTNSLGYKTIFWSVAYADWSQDNRLGAQKSYRILVDKLHNGAIYLLHSVSKDNTEILDSFIDTARSKGYEFSLYS